jgi:flagellar biosynthesis protein FlhB
MPEQHGDKTQDPTPHRRQQAREQGQVAKSQDLSSAVILTVGVVALLMLGGQVVRFFVQYAKQQLGGAPILEADAAFAAHTWMAVTVWLAQILLPILGLVVLTAVASNVLQIGFFFLPEKLMPDLNRINPLKGLSRIFSLSNVVHLLFGLFKISVITVVAYWCLWKQKETILGLMRLTTPEIACFLGEILLWTTLKIGAALMVLALLDFGFQRWKHEHDLRMTPQEVREELKNLEGNPLVLSRRRQVQRQLAMGRLSAAVPKADVVITNPTELAVAIEYESESMAAPIVVAKGAGVIAQRIRELALQHGIPLVEKKPLAQALYREVELNHPIPADKYAAVAEILAYVYQLKGKSIPTPAGNSG